MRIRCNVDRLLQSDPPQSLTLYAHERFVVVTLSCEER
jgi:hypothetical protein